jgi:hypothetical protein
MELKNVHQSSIDFVASSIEFFLVVYKFMQDAKKMKCFFNDEMNVHNKSSKALSEVK